MKKTKSTVANSFFDVFGQLVKTNTEGFEGLLVKLGQLLIICNVERNGASAGV